MSYNSLLLSIRVLFSFLISFNIFLWLNWGSVFLFSLFFQIFTGLFSCFLHLLFF